MAELAPHWETKRHQLAENYTDESGEYAEHCGQLAIEFAKILKARGETPSLLWLEGPKVDEYNTAPLIPKPYEGRLSWGAHCVCVSEGIVYDPILEAPEPWESYGETAFGVTVNVFRVKQLDED